MTVDFITLNHFINVITVTELSLNMAAHSSASAPEVEAAGAFHTVYLPEGSAPIKGCFGSIVKMKIPNEGLAAGERKLGSLTQLAVSDMPFY